MKYSKTFGKYLAELDTSIDDEGATQCIITYKGYSATLAAAEMTGYLYDNNDAEHDIDEETLDKISEWAVAHGY